MATLAPSLRRIFNECDATWPNRDRRTDGWYRNCKWVDHGTDHCPTSDGMVHAIDIDKDKMDPDFVVSRLIRYPKVIRYVIWNRHIWHNRDGFVKRTYTGTSNPHTDHIHVSIEHTDYAEQYSGGYGISGSIGAIIGQIVGTAALVTAWDQATEIDRGAGHFNNIAKGLLPYRDNIKKLRG